MVKPEEIPDKLYFRIGEVSKLAGVEPHVLRYWESEFAEIRPKRTSSQQRLYRRADVELILAIKSLLHDQRFTLSGAKKILAEGGIPQTAVSPTETLPPSEALTEIKQELLKIRSLLSGKKS